MLMRLVVKVVYDKDGNKFLEFYEIDLLKELIVFIIKICEI